MSEFKSGCLICGKDLIYLSVSETSKCIYCQEEFYINERCIDGHYICNNCHSSGAMDIIEKYCLNASLVDPIEMANIIMEHPSVKMHGPEHHFLVPAVLLTAWFNVKGQHDLLDAKLIKAKKRAEMVPGGFCGTHGNCGAGVGAGIFISVLTEATPLSKGEWRMSNLMTARSLMSIANFDGPRCCKRNIYLSINEVTNFVQEQFNVKIPVIHNITCKFSKYNKECLFKNCIFFKGRV